MGFLELLAYLVFFGSLSTLPLVVVDIWTTQQDILQELRELREKEDDDSEDEFEDGESGDSATGFNSAMVSAAMVHAAKHGHIDMLKQCKQWGAINFGEAMEAAACNGHIEIVKLCKEWGA